MGRKPIHGDENNEEIKRLYVEEEASLNAIGRQFGMHPQIVKRKLSKMGVETRGKSTAMKLHHQQKKGKVTVGESESNSERSEG